MNNLILQHWTGNIIELTELSSINISRYAKKIGADYKLLRGNLFHSDLTTPCQKLHMLNEEFDEYDMVVMVDADMFVRNGMTENVFTDVQGIGRHTSIQERLVHSLKRQFPDLGDPNYPYWGGAIYRLDKQTRQVFRSHIRENEIIRFNNAFYDEGIMHRLAVLAKMEKSYVPGNQWDCGNYEPEIETASIIHIRTKIAPNGPKRSKMENYRDLVNKKIIKE